MVLFVVVGVVVEIGYYFAVGNEAMIRIVAWLPFVARIGVGFVVGMKVVD